MKLRTTQNKKVTLTSVNLKKLQDELNTLTKQTRPAIIAELQAARKQGDLSENAEYDAAKEKQSVIEKKIREINRILSNYRIVNEKESDVVRIGRTVVLRHDGTKEKMKFKIGTLSDFSIDENIISSEAPLGKRLIGKCVGEKVFVKGTKESYWIEILEIH